MYSPPFPSTPVNALSDSTVPPRLTIVLVSEFIVESIGGMKVGER